MTVIESYIAQQNETVQPQLQRIYTIVRDELDDLADGWKYGISTFIHREKPILGFAATKKGISIYPYGNSTITPLLEDEIAPYVTGGGTLSFPTGTEIPEDLLRRICQVRKTYIDTTLKK